MNAIATDSTTSLAAALNADCQCIVLDRGRLAARLERDLGSGGNLLESRPGLASGSVVFVDPRDVAAMDRTARIVHRVLTSPACLARVNAQAPAIARLPRDSAGILLGLDFHLGGRDPQLIEINTNPGGLLVNVELARAVTADCDCVADPLADLGSSGITLSAIPSLITASLAEEWNRLHAGAPLRNVAIVDDDPAQQYLYPEFLLYQRLFAAAGWNARIVDASDLGFRDGRLVAGDAPIDLVYNRLTDFYFSEPRHAALRSAYEAGVAAITPHPAAHARWADKRLLAWLRDDTLLEAAGVGADDRKHLLCTIPPTEIVERSAADDLWQRRKELFFKPVDGYGSKGAYRGDKLTRSTFDRILAGRYVAQSIAPTSTRRVVVDGQPADLHVDIRNYCHRGSTWLRAARLYRGQTTNFRTPGGGFAPVLALPA